MKDYLKKHAVILVALLLAWVFGDNGQVDIDVFIAVLLVHVVIKGGD